jgi:class 3 adenylate cyclase
MYDFNNKAWLKNMVGEERNLLVGFIDQGRFSSGTKGFHPKNMFEYVEPFLSDIMDLVLHYHGWVDKLFGDEVMFEFINWEAKEPGWLMSFLESAREIVRAKVPSGKARLTFSFGLCMFVQFNVRQYSEINVFGTPINAAKRLQGVSGLIDPVDLGVAIGIADNEKESSVDILASKLERLLGKDFKSIKECPSFDAKGVGKIWYRDDILS